MEYQKFISLWLEALGQARFPGLHLLRPNETIDIRFMDRTYKNYLWWPETPETMAFNVPTELSWVWDSLLSARFATTEGDMLMQIYGDFGIQEDTETPWLRIDLALHARISLDERFPLPVLENWQRLVREVSLELEPFLPGENDSEDNDQDTPGWYGNPEAAITFDARCQTEVTP